MQNLTLTEETVEATLDALALAGELAIEASDTEDFKNAYLEIHAQVEDSREID